MALTPPGHTRERVYRFVARRLREGEPPTVRDVQRALGFAAVESARKHLQALVAEGRLVKTDGIARGYRLPDRAAAGGAAVVRVPVLGRVQAGDLQAAIEDPDGYVLAESRHEEDELFALRVRGDSMVGAAIVQGDLVIVRRQADAASGQLVVALVDDEATIKTLRRRGRRVELHPANPTYQPIRPRPGALQILGVVVELRRAL